MAPEIRYTGAEYYIGLDSDEPTYFDLVDLGMLTPTDDTAYDMLAQCLHVDTIESDYSCFCTQNAEPLTATSVDDDDVACLNIFYFNITDTDDST